MALPHRLKCSHFRRLYESSVVFQVIEKSQVVAIAIVYPVTKRVWQLEYLAVTPECQSRGFGRLLIETILRKYTYVSLDCESTLITYYSRFGFQSLNRWLYYRSTATCVMIAGITSLREKNQVFINLSNKTIGNIIVMFITSHIPSQVKKIPP